MFKKVRITAITSTILLGAFVSALCAQVRIVPIAQGWSRNQINTIIFRKNSVTSFKSDQYTAFYDSDSRVVLAKRKFGETKWQIRQTHLTGNTADAHNSISVAIDGAGFLHIAWNNYNSRLNYTRGEKAGSIIELPDTSAMTGSREDRVTYPEFYNLPDGDLLFLYRDGSSGSGNLVLNRYDVRSKQWTRVHDNLIDGEGRRNAYPQSVVDANGTIHISWVWRETPDVATNHDLCYARSNDGGKTWTKSTGEKYQLPITAATAEYIWRIPEKSELINQTSMDADAVGNIFIATYWRDANSAIPQYRLVHFDGKTWRVSRISDRKTPFSLSGAGTKRIPISRPQVVVDRRGPRTRSIVLFRDAERQDRVSVATSEDLSQGSWTIRDLTQTGVGMWEPAFDQALWRAKGQLHIFVQLAGQGDAESLEPLSPQMVSILEWKP